MNTQNPLNNMELVGAWKLITFEFRKEDGEVIYPFGAEAQGTIIYTESGRYSGQLMRKDRPRFAIADQMKGTTEEIEFTYKGSISYFGTYEVDPENKVINHYVEGSLFPNMEGSNQRRSFELTKDKLVLQTQPFKVNGEKVIGVLQWEKVEKETT